MRLTLIDKAFFLKKTLLFATLDFDLLLAIADKLNVISFDPGEPVFGYQEDAYHMYFIVNGTVAIRDNYENLIATLGVNDFFGDESIFNEKPRAYAATCQVKSLMLALSRTNLLTIIYEYPSVAVGFLQAYTSMTGFRPRKQIQDGIDGNTSPI